MREVRLSGEEGGPSPPQENAAADRGGGSPPPQLPAGGKPGILSTCQADGPGAGSASPTRPGRRGGGGLGTWGLEEPGSQRPDPQPGRAGQGGALETINHAGRLRPSCPREPRPTGTGAFPAPKGLLTAGPSTRGGPKGIPSEGNFPLRVPARGQSGTARRPPAAPRTSSAGLLGSGRHPGDQRAPPRCRGRDPGSDP